MIQSLFQLEDATRILQKFLLGRGDSADLIAISTTVEVWSSVQRRLELEKDMELCERGNSVQNEWASLEIVLSRLHSLNALVTRIKAAIVVEDSAHRASGDMGEQITSRSSSNGRASVSSYNWNVRPECVSCRLTCIMLMFNLGSRRN